MSSIIFETVPGRLVAINSNEQHGLILDLNGLQSRGVVHSLKVDQSVAAQFQPSLDRSVYVVPFGDNIGNMSAGVILNDACGSGTAGSDKGTDSFLKYYAEKKLSPTNPLPGKLIIGNSVFLGYAIGFDLSVDSSSGYLVSGTLNFAAWLAQT